jgi:hypothetical protein
MERESIGRFNSGTGENIYAWVNLFSDSFCHFITEGGEAPEAADGLLWGWYPTPPVNFLNSELIEI